MPLPPTIPQQATRLDIEPYVIGGFMPEAQPFIGAFSVSGCFAGVADVGDDIEDVLTIDLGARSRWVADPATLTDHGDGTWRWVPSQGSDLTPFWKFIAANVPAIDTTYDYLRKNRTTLVRPALIFDGDMWAQLQSFPDPLSDGFTVMLVTRLRGTNGAARAGIVESLVSGADPDSSSDIYFRQRGDYLRSQTKGIFVEDLVEDTGRPQIIGASHDTNLSRQLLIDRDRTTNSYHHPTVSAYDASLYLGRSGSTYDASATSRMDLCDIALWDRALTRDELHHAGQQLNSVYAVRG